MYVCMCVCTACRSVCTCQPYTVRLSALVRSGDTGSDPIKHNLLVPPLDLALARRPDCPHRRRVATPPLFCLRPLPRPAPLRSAPLCPLCPSLPFLCLPPSALCCRVTASAARSSSAASRRRSSVEVGHVTHTHTHTHTHTYTHILTHTRTVVHCRHSARAASAAIQPRLRNCPVTDALCTARLLSLLFPPLLCAVLRALCVVWAELGLPLSDCVLLLRTIRSGASDDWVVTASEASGSASSATSSFPSCPSAPALAASLRSSGGLSPPPPSQSSSASALSFSPHSALALHCGAGNGGVTASSHRSIFTLCQKLDGLLGDGVRLEELTEFCGVPGVGRHTHTHARTHTHTHTHTHTRAYTARLTIDRPTSA